MGRGKKQEGTQVPEQAAGESWAGQSQGAPPPPLPWTVDIAAAVWGISEPRVRVLCDEGRVEHEKRGKKHTIIILQTERPSKDTAPCSLPVEVRERRDSIRGITRKRRYKVVDQDAA